MPKGYPRFKKAQPGQSAPYEAIKSPPGAFPKAGEDPVAHYSREILGEETQAPELPRGWAKGAHLNVRNVGHEYRITLFPEEFDSAQPERCLRFTNPVNCQNFVSAWYSRESHDPRAR